MKKHNPIFEKIEILFIIIIYLFLTNFTCLIKLFTGFPCPACGITRAYKSLLNLDFTSAFRYHPLFLFLPIVLMIIIFSKKPILGSEKRQMIFYILTFTIIFSVYIYRMITMFPDTPPMDYNTNSKLYLYYLKLKSLLNIII